MKIAALVSGGKDSIYSIMECIKYGHEVIALGNLCPPLKQETEIHELDSFMFQSVSVKLVELMSKSMRLPLVRYEIKGKAVEQKMEYHQTDGDEVEDLFALLQRVIELYPDVEGVCTGAIFSDYQRCRVENVCTRLGLASIGYLWRRDQSELLDEMIHAGLESVLVKVASMGLMPKPHLGKSIGQLRRHFESLNEKYKFHVCGEGGEYETITLDCPLFHERIVIDDSEILIHSDDIIAPVGLLNIKSCHLEQKIDFIPMQAPTHTVANTQNKIVRTVARSTMDGMADVKNFKQVDDQVHLSGISVQVPNATIGEESAAVFERMQALLGECNLTFDDALFVHLYVQDMQQFNSINKVYCAYFGQNPASRCCVEVPMEGCRIMADCFALRDSKLLKKKDKKLHRVLHIKTISTWAPTCIGPYSQANILKSAFIFPAGQIGLVPETMQMRDGGLECEAKQVFINLSRLLDALDSNLKHIVGGTVFLKNGVDSKASDNLLDQCNMLIDHNADEANRFEHDYDSAGEELEDFKSTQRYARMPLVFITVSTLPRDASIEVEVFAMTHKAMRYLDCRVSQSDVMEQDGYQMECDYASIPSILCLINCTIALRSDCDSNLTFAQLESCIRSAMKVSRLHTNQIVHIRVYYKHSPAVCLFLKVCSDSNLFQNTSVTTIPVSAVHRESMNYDILVQCSSYDFAKAETDLWLNKVV